MNIISRIFFYNKRPEQYLAIDSGDELTNKLRVVIAARLNASQRSRIDVGMNSEV